MAIHNLKDKLQFPIDCRHVYGHQDDKKKKDKKKKAGNKSPLDKMRDRLNQSKPDQITPKEAKQQRQVEKPKTQHNYESLLEVERLETAKPPAFDEETGQVFGLTSRFALIVDEDDCNAEED